MAKIPACSLSLMLLGWLFLGTNAAGAAKLLDVVKIWDQGPHNAFTDLVRWRGKWYCVFREADGHVGGDGKLRVLESADGKAWESAALVAESGIDLRDPHLSITPDDRLMMVAGGSVYKGKTLLGRQPRVAFSKDGRTWTPPQRVLTEGEWLWRVTWHDGRAYGVSYNAGERQSKDAKEAAKSDKPLSTAPADWKLKLVTSKDGVAWELLTHLGVPGHPNETTLRFLANGDLMAMVRREGGSTFGWIGTAKAPYKEWNWHETKYRFGGPNFIQLPDGSLVASSRRYLPKGAKTVVARMTAASYEPILELPSGGDTSYAGLVWHEGVLWVSYYSSHEKKSSIYLAKVDLADKSSGGSAAGQGKDALYIGDRLELFVDDFLIDKLTGTAARRLHKPTPREVVFTFDRPWEGNTCAYFTIFCDGDVFRMYYRGAQHDAMKPAHAEVACYAESKDGIHWTRPTLGLHDFKGSKDNNIVWTGPGSHNFTPFKDANPKATADARYKALAGGKGGLLALKSVDGIHWSLLSPKPVITKGNFDSQNLAFWDSVLGKYRDFHRTTKGVRDITTCVSDDFVNWSEPVFLQYPGAPTEHLYTNAIRPYDRAPHILLGFPARFKPATQQVEPQFMSSRDGLTFLRWPEPIIPITAPKDRDGNRSNYMAWGMVELPGKNGELSVYATEAYYGAQPGRLRRFSYRVDGFVSVHASSEGGELLSKPLIFKGDKLILNFATAPKGSVAVELEDSAGKAIPGFSLKDCQILRGDAVTQSVTWKGGSLAKIAGTPVRVRFVLRDADVYSVRFE